MNIKKSLLALVVLALAIMGLASSVMAAEDGVVKDVTTNESIATGTKLHFVGWAKFQGELGGIECHVTSEVEATSASTGKVTNFSVPDVTKCTRNGGLTLCTLTSVTADNLPYSLTATKTDFDVSDGTAVGGGPIRITNAFTGSFCAIAGTSSLTFPSGVTLKPLKAGTRTITNTLGHLGELAAAGEAIAGAELSGTGKIDKPGGGEETITASGQLELAEGARGTYKLE